VFALQRPEFRQSLPACVRSSTWPASCIAAIVEISKSLCERVPARADRDVKFRRSPQIERALTVWSDRYAVAVVDPCRFCSPPLPPVQRQEFGLPRNWPDASLLLRARWIAETRRRLGAANERRVQNDRQKI
jgi:hypothetical protein